MLLELLPELFPPILTWLTVKDIKNISLCSKLSNHLVTPTLWENVRVTSDRLLASTSVPSHIAFARNLRIDCNVSLLTRSNKKDEQKFTKKLVALLKLSSPTTLSFLRCSEVSTVTRYLATVSGLTHLKNLELSWCNISDAGVEHIGRLSGLVNLNISDSGDISDAGLKHIRRLTGLVNLDISYNKNISDAGLEYLIMANWILTAC